MISWIYNTKIKKGKLWYIIAISIIIAFSIWGLIMQIYAMTVVILLLAGVYFLIENNSEANIKVTIDNEGINISKTFYAYAQIEDFAIIYSGRNPILLRLKLKGKKNSAIDIYLIKGVNVGDLRLFLGQFITEKANVELSFMEIVLHLLKI